MYIQSVSVDRKESKTPREEQKKKEVYRFRFKVVVGEIWLTS